MRSVLANESRREASGYPAAAVFSSMKTSLLPITFALAAVAFLSGCTTTTQTASTEGQRPDVEITSEQRSYSQRELQKRGRQTVGESLAAQDASVRVSGGR